MTNPTFENLHPQLRRREVTDLIADCAGCAEYRPPALLDSGAAQEINAPSCRCRPMPSRIRYAHRPR